MPSLGRRVIVRSMMKAGTSITRPKYRFGPCVLPFGSDSFSHVVRLRPLRRFILHSPCRTHPSGRVRRIPNVSALSQGLHTLVLLRTHALVGSMGNESHGYFTFPFFTFLLIAFMSHTRVRHIGQCDASSGIIFSEVVGKVRKLSENEAANKRNK